MSSMFHFRVADAWTRTDRRRKDFLFAKIVGTNELNKRKFSRNPEKVWMYRIKLHRLLPKCVNYSCGEPVKRAKNVKNKWKGAAAAPLFSKKKLPCSGLQTKLFHKLFSVLATCIVSIFYRESLIRFTDSEQASFFNSTIDCRRKKNTVVLLLLYQHPTWKV